MYPNQLNLIQNLKKYVLGYSKNKVSNVNLSLKINIENMLSYPE